MIHADFPANKPAFKGSFFSVSEYEDVWGEDWLSLFPLEDMDVASSTEVLGFTSLQFG